MGVAVMHWRPCTSEGVQALVELLVAVLAVDAVVVGEAGEEESSPAQTDSFSGGGNKLDPDMSVSSWPRSLRARGDHGANRLASGSKCECTFAFAFE